MDDPSPERSGWMGSENEGEGRMETPNKAGRRVPLTMTMVLRRFADNVCFGFRRLPVFANCTVLAREGFFFQKTFSHLYGGFGGTEVSNNSLVELTSSNMNGTPRVCIPAECDCSLDVFQISTSRFFDFDVSPVFPTARSCSRVKCFLHFHMSMEALEVEKSSGVCNTSPVEWTR